MKLYFKHACDAHEGHSLQTLMDEFQHKGPTCYWILVEICTKKFWESAAKNPEIPLGKVPTTFRFHRRLIFQKLRVGHAFAQRFFARCNELQLFSSRVDGSSVEFSMPKIVEILDPDEKKRAKDRRLKGEKKAPRVHKHKQSSKSPKPPKTKTEPPQTQIEEADPNQLELPGIMVPSESVSALDLLANVKAANNAAEKSGRKAKTLTPAKDIVRNIVRKEES